jgi:two-component system OmpR family response regulator
MNATPLRVAHVDDDEDLRALVRVALELDGSCAVASCASGREALRVIPSFHPDVILVDMMMPGMDGLETVAALRERMPLDDVAVVFATGMDDATRLAALRRHGAVIAKPFDALGLAGRLHALRGA